jgi:hypothetical protein
VSDLDERPKRHSAEGRAGRDDVTDGVVGADRHSDRISCVHGPDPDVDYFLVGVCAAVVSAPDACSSRSA